MYSKAYLLLHALEEAGFQDVQSRFLLDLSELTRWNRHELVVWDEQANCAVLCVGQIVGVRHFGVILEKLCTQFTALGIFLFLLFRRSEFERG